MCSFEYNLTVTLSRVEHDGEVRLKIEFPYHAEAGERVKLIKGRRWSQTMRAWHLPFNKDSVDALRMIFDHLEFLDEESKEFKEINFEERKDEVLIWKNDGYIYIKVRVDDLQARSFLSKLEMSRNYHSSGYWKIKDTGASSDGLTKKFGSRLHQWPLLPGETENYDQEHQMRNKVTVILTGKRVRVITVKNPELIGYIKTMPFYKWDPVNKWWSFAFSEMHLKLFTDFCYQHKYDLVIDNIHVFKKVQGRNYDKNSPCFRKCPVEMLEKLQNKRYSQRTIEQYCSIFEEFINYHRRIAIEDIGTKEIQEFIGYLIQERRVSPSSQNLAVNAIKFYFEKVLGGPRRFIEIDRPRPERKLPKVLTVKDIRTMIGVTVNLKHKLVIIVLYSTGIRRGELLQLKLEDIDRENMRILIRSGKGNKDRFVNLAHKTLAYIDEYRALYDPKEFLFEGHGAQYTESSVAAVVRNAARKAGIKKEVTPHMFRHTFATHMLELGYDTRYIQDLLGHSSIRTTSIYEHITQKGLNNIVNPFDKLDF